MGGTALTGPPLPVAVARAIGGHLGAMAVQSDSSHSDTVPGAPSWASGLKTCMDRSHHQIASTNQHGHSTRLQHMATAHSHSTQPQHTVFSPHVEQSILYTASHGGVGWCGAESTLHLTAGVGCCGAESTLHLTAGVGWCGAEKHVKPRETSNK